MTTPRLLSLQVRSTLAIITGLLLVLANIGGIGGAVESASASPLGAVPGQGVTIPAGGSASIQVRGFAMQPQATLPQSPLTLAQTPLASDRVRTVLFYGIDWGYTDTDPQQVALAIWWAQDGTWHSPDHAIADRLANAAGGASGLPFWNPDGRSLVMLDAQGTLALSPLTLVGGAGTLNVRNTGSQDVTVYLPYGTLFAGADGAAIVWAAGGQVSGATPTAQVATPTSTQAPAATNTPEPSPTGYVKPGATPPWLQPTATQVQGNSEPTATPTAQPVDPTATATAGLPSVEPPSLEATDTPTAPPTTAPIVKPGTGADTPTAAAAAPVVQKPTATATIAPPKLEGLATAPRPEGPARAAAAVPLQPDKQLPAATDAAPAPPPQDATAPPPVGTQAGQAPGPVSTGSVPNNPPNPELTRVAPVSTQKVPENPTFTPAVPVKQTPTPMPTTAPSGSNDTGNPGNSGNADATPVPQPTPLPPSQPGEKEPPTIIVAPDNGNAQPPAQDNKPTASSGTGPQPTTNPITGAGASSLPAWLGLLSVLLVLGGWALRRVANATAAAQPVAQAAQGDE